MGRGADEVRLGAARLAKAPNGINEVERPADEQGDHEQLDVDHQVIHFLAMLGGERRQGEDFHFERTICWPVTGLDAAAAAAAALFIRKIKNAAIPPSTKSTTTKRLKMPMFMP